MAKEDKPVDVYNFECWVHGSSRKELLQRLEEIIEDLQIDERDVRSVVSSNGYWFTLKHNPGQTKENYQLEVQAYVAKIKSEKEKQQSDGVAQEFMRTQIESEQ